MNYRNRVAAWVCANILAERAAAPIVIPIQPFAKVVDSIHERGAQIELSPCGPNHVILLTESGSRLAED